MTLKNTKSKIGIVSTTGIKRISFSIWLSVFFLSGCSQVSQISDHLIQEPRTHHRAIRVFRKQVNALINAPEFQPGFFGILIKEANTGEEIFACNPDRLFMPASNMKLFTTTTAMALLDSNFTYKTDLYINGEIKNDTLFGDLIIKGSGDPTISGRFYNDNVLAVFQEWIGVLDSLKIKHITGKIIGDDNIMDDYGLGYGWAWDDLAYYYAAPTGGLTYNDNCLDFRCWPSINSGEPANIQINPQTKYVEITNEVLTVPAGEKRNIDFFRQPGTNKIRIYGQIPADADTVNDSIALENPTLYTCTVFKETLNSSGITGAEACDVDDLGESIPDYSQLQLIAEHQSVKLPQIIKTINKISHNLYAEQVQKTLGVVFKQAGSTEAGIAVERAWFGSIGIDTTCQFIVDGSGLSRHNLITPRQVVTMLSAIQDTPNYPHFFNSLPIMGVDGTVKSRLKGSNAAGHVFAKTGYVDKVRALSGYVQAQDGREYIFSIIANHYATPTSAINDLQDKIVTLLYNLEY